MSQIVSNLLYNSQAVTQLDTYNYTIPAAGSYQIQVTANEIPPSGLSMVIQQNSSTKATSTTLAAAQNTINLQVPLVCAQGDTISFILSSSTPSDQMPNSFKALLNIRQSAN